MRIPFLWGLVIIAVAGCKDPDNTVVGDQGPAPQTTDDPMEAFQEAVALHERKEYKAAFRKYLPIAKGGPNPARAAAQYNVGLLYASGKATGAEEQEIGKCWWTRSAAEGYEKSQDYLIRYREVLSPYRSDICDPDERAVRDDPNAAIKEFQEAMALHKRKEYKAAFKKYLPIAKGGPNRARAAAQYNVGLLYASGKATGVAEEEIAKCWWTRSASQGFKKSETYLARHKDRLAPYRSDRCE